jgi:hypothetical protein
MNGGARAWSVLVIATGVLACSAAGDASDDATPSAGKGGSGGNAGAGGDGGSHAGSAAVSSVGSAAADSMGDSGANVVGSAGAAGNGTTADSGTSHPSTDGGPPPADVCTRPEGCTAGTWVDVTPAEIDLKNGGCGNFGAKTVQTDALHPEVFYTLFFCQGVWKSTDYGQTWKGPINTGAHAAEITDCAGGIALPRNNTVSPPIIYAACIRGSGLGVWKSTNGGIDWTNRKVTPGADLSGQQFYAPAVDPYDANHLLMAGHAVDVLVESTDGGESWSLVTTNPGMKQNGGTGGIDFIDTGSAATTRTTWLWLAAQSGGNVGTWRTTNAGHDWTQVETNEHINGESQLYQPDKSGGVFMAGVYSKQGWGVFRSPDFGVTWAHVGQTTQEAIVFGTPKNLYAMYGWGIGAGGMVDPSLEVASLPGTGTWTKPGTPAAMTQGPAQAAVTFDGKNSIIVTASYNAGVWRYVEP